MIPWEERLAPAVKNLPPSGIRRFFDLAATLDDVISLGVGEPDFVTPWHIREAGLAALERGMTAYTANAGLMALREAIARDLERYALTYDPGTELLVTVGGSEAIDLALRALVRPGDEVLVPEPAYVSYRPLVELAGGRVVSVPLRPERGFRLDAQDLAARITSRTRLMIWCNPNNPTGSAVSGEDLLAVAKTLGDHDLVAISDEIYADIRYHGRHESLAAQPEMRERTVLIGGFSKAFAMTGWRLGFAAGPSPVIHAMLRIHQYAALCAPVMAQVAAIEALTAGRPDVEQMVAEYDRRRRLIVRGLSEAGLLVAEPDGAFYVFPDIRRSGLSSMEFAENLLREERVAVVPGSVFGQQGEGYVRCSYATGVTQIEEALHRIGRFMARRASAVQSEASR